MNNSESQPFRREQMCQSRNATCTAIITHAPPLSENTASYLGIVSSFHSGDVKLVVFLPGTWHQ